MNFGGARDRTATISVPAPPLVVLVAGTHHSRPHAAAVLIPGDDSDLSAGLLVGERPGPPVRDVVFVDARASGTGNGLRTVGVDRELARIAPFAHIDADCRGPSFPGDE